LSKHVRSRSNNSHSNIVALLVALGACTGELDRAPSSSSLPEQTRRDELFWKHRLSVPPDVAPRPLVGRGLDQALSLARELRDAELAELESILREVVEIGPGAIPVLVDGLFAEDREAARRNLVLALIALDDPRGAGPLCGLLRDSSAQVALLAARGLGELAVPWTLPRLIKVVGRYDVTPWLIVRVEAAAALLRFQNYSGVPFLLKVLKEHTALEDNRDREWGRRLRIVFEKEAAARALAGLIGEDFGYSPNAPYPRQERAILEMEDWWSEHATELWAGAPPLSDPELLCRIGWLADGLALYQIRTVDNARFILKSLGPPALPALERHLDDPRFYVRVHLLEALAQMGATLAPQAESLARILAPHLADPEPAIRTQAVRILGTARMRAASSQVVTALGDADGSVRLSAIRVLGLIGGPAARELLRPLAESKVADDFRAGARASLVRLGDREALEALLDDLLDPDLRAQASALEALGELGAPISEFPLGGPLELREPHSTRIRDTLAGP